MNIAFKKNGIVLLFIITAISTFSATSCSPLYGISLGMSTEEVVERLGEPDSKAILEGKVLRTIEEESEIDYRKYRVVYLYESKTIQVWFQNGIVSGATKKGVSML